MWTVRGLFPATRPGEQALLAVALFAAMAGGAPSPSGLHRCDDDRSRGEPLLSASRQSAAVAQLLAVALATRHDDSGAKPAKRLRWNCPSAIRSWPVVWGDITRDATDWANRCMARFYVLPSVRLAAPGG